MLSLQYLFIKTYLFKNPIIEQLLELLVAVIDTKLFKAVEFIVFCADGKQNIYITLKNGSLDDAIQEFSLA